MIVRSHRPDQKRSGATLVESAFVISIFMLFLYGVIEYGRFVMIYQGMQNAAREGARYAVAVINPENVNVSSIDAEVRRRLKGLDPNTSKFTVAITGISLRNDPDNPLNTQLTDWSYASNQDGVKIAIDYTFHPALPSFLFWNKDVPMKATAIMYSEGN